MRQILIAFMFVVISTPAVAGDMMLRCYEFDILVAENFLGMKSAKYRPRGESAWRSSGNIKVRDNRVIYTPPDGTRYEIDLLPKHYDDGVGRHKRFRNGKISGLCSGTTDRPR